MNYLRTSSGVLLGEVSAHVFLQVEEGEFIRLAKSQEFAKFSISTDDSPVLGILEVVLADILVDFTGYFSSCHFGAVGSPEELGKFVRDGRRFGETTGFALTRSPLSGSLLGGLDFSFTSGPEGSDLSTQGSDLSSERGELG